MKPKAMIQGCRKHAAKTSLTFVGCVVVGAGMVLAASPDANADAGQAEATSDSDGETLENWVDFSVGGVFIDGDDAAYQERHGNNGDFMVGISSLHFEQEVGEDGTLTLDGHAMYGMDDYLLSVRYDHSDVGFVEAGYREFRSWYDPSGGIENPAFVSPLELDRGEVWFQAGLRMEDVPEVTFQYIHRWRNGMKDSTIWESNQTPGYYDIDETSDIFMLDINHTVSNTDLALSLRYQNDQVDNSHRTAGSAVPEALDSVESDLFSSSLSSQTRINDQMMLSFAYMFTRLDTDLDGSFHDEDVFIFGGSDFTQHVLNANFWWQPVEDLSVITSMRTEWQNINGASIERDAYIGGAVVSRGMQDSGIDVYNATEELEVRYSGLPDMLLYGRFQWTQGDKDSGEYELDRNANIRRIVDVDTGKGKYVLGANWYPMSGVSLAAQYFYENRDQSFTSNDASGNRDLGAQMLEHNSETNDINLRLTWRAAPNLTLISRYDFVQTTIENRTTVYPGGVPTILALIESADISKHVFSESVTWSPVENAYLQGTFSYIKSSTDTPADTANPAVIHDSDNDYTTASLTAGYSFDKNTDLTVGYTYFRADDYSGFPTALGFGTDLEEHMFSVALNRRINANMIWNLGYAFYKSNDGSGGINNYDAHLVSTGLQVRF